MTDFSDNANQKKDLNLVDLLKFFVSQKRMVIVISLTGFLLGVLVAILTPIQYTSVVRVVQEGAGSKGGGNGQISALAGLAGIDIGGSSDASFNPLLYPKVVASVPFQQQLMNSEFYFSAYDDPITYKKYLEEAPRSVGYHLRKYTLELPFTILDALKGSSEETPNFDYGDSVIVLTESEVERLVLLRQQTRVAVDTKSGLITITATLPEKVAAMQMANLVLAQLQEFVVRTKLMQLNEKAKYLEQRYIETKEAFYEAQTVLADFKDSNMGITSSMAETREQRLKDEYDLAYSLYQEIAKQLETTRIELKDNTPVFSIVEPAVVPAKKSAPRRTMIVFVWSFIGVIISIIFVYLKLIWLRVRPMLSKSQP